MAQTGQMLRSRDDRWITGTASGLATKMEWEPLYVRIGIIVLGLLTGPIMLIAYIILAVMTEEEPAKAVAAPAESAESSESAEASEAETATKQD